jgi:D-glycero-D-manno-heptose 1,7-bisphosphate phosphatase
VAIVKDYKTLNLNRQAYCFFKIVLKFQTMENKAVFFDRDGTLLEMVYNEESEIIDSPSKPSEVRLSPGITDALKYLKSLGYLLFVVSNQPRIGIRKLTEDAFEEVRKKFNEELEKGGVELEKEYYCFHHPFAQIEKYRQECRCRKPGTLFFEQAEKEFDIDLSKSWMVGDGVNDVLAGHKAGTKTILIANLLETAYLTIIEDQLKGVKPDFIIKKPKEIVEVIKS